ncbi:MAG TPA: HtaA domain-containing protein [Gryllotalpicola sp.]
MRGGYLVWGFKSSFRRYVGAGFPSNTITARGGASILNGDLAIAGQPGTGTFSWPFRSSSSYTSTSVFSVQYGGSIEFSYPAHFFDITIANPKVVVTGTSGTLLADLTVTVTEPGTAPVTTAKKAEKLATIGMSGTSPVIDDTGVTRLLHTAIADASSFSFDGTDFYTPGQALDDATVFLAGCASAPSKPAAGAVPPSSPGGSSGGSGGEVLTPSGSDDPSASGSGGIIPTTRFRPTPSAGAAARPAAAPQTADPAVAAGGRPGLSIPADRPGADRAAPTAAATPIVPLIAAAAVLLAGLLAFLLLRRRAARLRAAAAATTGGAP